MTRAAALARALALCAALAGAATQAGCSWLLVNGPAAPPAPPRCTSLNILPGVDTVATVVMGVASVALLAVSTDHHLSRDDRAILQGGGLIYGSGALVFGLSAYSGFGKTRRCRAAEADYDAATRGAYPTYPQPYRYPQPYYAPQPQPQPQPYYAPPPYYPAPTPQPTPPPPQPEPLALTRALHHTLRASRTAAPAPSGAAAEWGPDGFAGGARAQPSL